MKSMFEKLLIFSLIFVQPVLAVGERLPGEGLFIACAEKKQRPRRKKNVASTSIPAPTPTPSPTPTPTPVPVLPFAPPSTDPPANDGDTGGSPECKSISLTGTYRLDSALSDNSRAAIEEATSELPSDERQYVFEQLLNRSVAPEMFAIASCNHSVTIASSLAPQITFEADGREYREISFSGRPVALRADLGEEQLVITSRGDRNSDFSVIIEPIENGRRLSMRRSISSERLKRQVVVRSVYDKIFEVPQWNIYNISEGRGYAAAASANDNFIVPDGTQLVAVLNNDIHIDHSQEGNRFTMTARTPAQYAGTIIEGYVSNLDRGERTTGGAGMTLHFERLRLPGGRTYRFSGAIQSVRTTGGETVMVCDNRNAAVTTQTNTSSSRTSAGNSSDNGSGDNACAAISSRRDYGAGYLYVLGRDVLRLPSGSEVTIRVRSSR